MCFMCLMCVFMRDLCTRFGICGVAFKGEERSEEKECKADLKGLLRKLTKF